MKSHPNAKEIIEVVIQWTVIFVACLVLGYAVMDLVPSVNKKLIDAVPYFSFVLAGLSTSRSVYSLLCPASEVVDVEEAVLKKHVVELISGKKGIESRKLVSESRPISLKVNGKQYCLQATGDQVLVREGERVVLQLPFVPWGNVDREYAKLINPILDEYSLSLDDEFERISSAYHDRFDIYERI